MNNLSEFYSLLHRCITLYRLEFPGGFALATTVAVLLGALCWFICVKWTALWHKSFHARPVHQALCALATALTLVFVITFPSLGTLEKVARECVDNWSDMLARASGRNALLSASDERMARTWNARTFLTARHELFAIDQQRNGSGGLTREAWRSKFTLPLSGDISLATLTTLAGEQGWALHPDETHARSSGESDNFLVPLDQGPLGEKAAAVYANNSIVLFQKRYPLLSWIIWPPKASVPESSIQRDLSVFWRMNPGAVYPLVRATDVARDEVNKELVRQAPRVVAVARVWLVILFFIAQAVPFGFIGWAAYQDLKANRQARPKRALARTHR